MNRTQRILATLAASFSVVGALSVATPAQAKYDDAETRFRTSWIWRNLDTREVARFRAMGFNDTEIKQAANLAMRTGLEMDYILRVARDGNQPIPDQAARWNVYAADLNDEIPGYGLDPALPSAMPMPSTTTTSSSTTRSSSSSSTTTTTTTTPATTTTPPPPTTPPATPPPAEPVAPPAEPVAPPAEPVTPPAEPATPPADPPARELAPL
jgi:hypothetical protein